MLTLIKRTGGVDTSDATAGPYQILTGYSGYVDDERIEGTMPNRGKYTYSLPVNTSHNIPDGWHNGTGKITQNLATQDSITVTPGTSPKLVCAADRWTVGNLWVQGDADLVAGNIKDKVTLFGVTGTYKGCVTTDATVQAGHILTGYSAYGSAGTKIAGTMPNNGTTNHSLGVNGSFTIPAGWHNGNGKVTQSLTTQAGWTATPGTGNILLCSAERWTTGDIWIKGDGNLAAGNIKKGVTIFGVTGTFDFWSGDDYWIIKDGVLQISASLKLCSCYSYGSTAKPYPSGEHTSYCGQPYKSGNYMVFRRVERYTSMASYEVGWTYEFKIPTIPGVRIRAGVSIGPSYGYASEYSAGDSRIGLGRWNSSMNNDNIYCNGGILLFSADSERRVIGTNSFTPSVKEWAPRYTVYLRGQSSNNSSRSAWAGEVWLQDLWLVYG